MSCLYPKKQRFANRAQALDGAETIKAHVERRGDTYDQLYPYLCPSAGKVHWHLSHREQMLRRCPVCQKQIWSWKGDETWVINQHPVQGPMCKGAYQEGTVP